MALKIMNETRVASLSNSIRAVTYAIKHGAKISSNSYGGVGHGRCKHYLPKLKNVLANAPEHLFVAAAGNDGNNNDDVPACPCNVDVPNAICVAASTKEQKRWKFSNFGPETVDVFAPGENIASLWKIHGQAEHLYAWANGTSMATPFVSGLAALILSINKGLSGKEVKELIKANVKKGMSGYTGQYVSSGGLIDIAKTIKHLSMYTVITLWCY